MLARHGTFALEAATAYNSLAYCLLDNGDVNRAVIVARRAVQICEQTKNISAGTKEKLAMCFSTLSTCLGSGGKHEAAASAVSLSVAICRELAKENPDKFGPNLALTLNNMAEGLAMSESSSNIGRLEEAAVEALQLMMPYFFERPPVLPRE